MRIIMILLTFYLQWGNPGITTLHADENERYADHWVATDALGRTLPSHDETGARRSAKYIGIFYFVWVGNHTPKVYDISKIMKNDSKNPQWGPVTATHFWGEPEQGYFHASDPWVIRRDMQMLVNADVDFLYLDTTNTWIYENTVEALLKVIHQMRSEGIPAPGVVFTTNTASGKTINRIYDHFYTNPENKDLWFEWDGMPLIFGIKEDPELRKELRDFFTIKRSWAWTKARTEPDHWQWQDTYPQDYGWSSSPKIPEQISVSTASHAANSIGKSYHNEKQPPVRADYTTEFTHLGLHFEEQWKRAHEVDPKVVMIGGWNEWVAGRAIRKLGDQNYLPLFAGRPPFQDGTTFVDVFSAEFTRDIAPMNSGYTDSYYYQMVSHIRRFKGMDPPPKRPAPRPIVIDGKFDDWFDVPVNYLDPPGDTMHRKFRGTDPNTTYINTFGRNDILSTRALEDRNHVHFMVSTANDLVSHTNAFWMTLLIDTDQNTGTGWEGYDLAVNWKTVSSSESTYAIWKDAKWKMKGKVKFGYRGKHLEISVPNSLFQREPSKGFDFKWVDNCRLETVKSLFTEGDAAPDRRFNFRY